MQNCQNCGHENPDDALDCSSCGLPLTEQIGNRCDFCAKRVPYSEYFTCKYCGKKLCYEHRLPENHLCKSTSMRRMVPDGASSAAGSYSYSSPYYTSTARSTFSLNLSRQGRNLIILILAGIVMGFVSSLFYGGLPLLYLIQIRPFVLQGWVVSLVTSIIVAPPNISGLEDVVFNAIALFFIDRLLANTYTPKQYYAVFFASGVFGNVLTLLDSSIFGSFGASGGIFGLLAGAVTFNYAITKRLNYSLLMWFLIWFFLSSVSIGVNWVAHIGGALLGFAAGYYLGNKRARSSNRRHSLRS